MRTLNKKGFTLIELMTVVAITAIMAVSVSVNMINFQKDAKLDASANELASVLETARNRSINGEIPVLTGDIDSNFLPYWSVELISATEYRLVPKCKLTDGTDCPPGNETYSIKSGTLNPGTGTVNFSRLSGKTTPLVISVKLNDYTETENVSVDTNGKVTISK